jgi:hypothetical protein
MRRKIMSVNNKKVGSVIDTMYVYGKFRIIVSPPLIILQEGKKKMTFSVDEIYWAQDVFKEIFVGMVDSKKIDKIEEMEI